MHNLSRISLRLHEAVELKLAELWCHRKPDESFLALFSKAATTVLEQPAALKVATYFTDAERSVANLRKAPLPDLWHGMLGRLATHYGARAFWLA